MTKDQKKDWLNRLLHLKEGGDKGKFADRLKLNRSSVSLYLSGKRELSDKVVYRIANRLKVDPPKGMSPLEEAPTPPQQTAKEEPDINPRLLAAIDRIVTQNDMQARVIINVSEKMEVMVEKMAAMEKQLTMQAQLLAGRAAPAEQE